MTKDYNYNCHNKDYNYHHDQNYNHNYHNKDYNYNYNCHNTDYIYHYNHNCNCHCKDYNSATNLRFPLFWRLLRAGSCILSPDLKRGAPPHNWSANDRSAAEKKQIKTKRQPSVLALVWFGIIEALMVDQIRAWHNFNANDGTDKNSIETKGSLCIKLWQIF